jgi:uncharacterized protein (DUF488 family)
MTLYTIGHSTYSIETFLGLLVQNEIAILVDVRSFPGSRRWPQFNQFELKASVECAGLSYAWFKVLGGRRRSSLHDSPHKAWEHAALRAYAEYGDTAEFDLGVAQLSELAAARRSAIMCAEGLWWRCHRRIIADHMTVLGCQVLHIMPGGRRVTHGLPNFARLDGARIIYDGEAG